MIKNGVIGKLKIANREYDTIDCELDQKDLLFYTQNPRIFSCIWKPGSILDPTQDEIEEIMCDQEHVKQLKNSIETNGGLIEPLIVRDGDWVVLEGNSRLAAYRILNKKNPIKWGKVKCKVLPANIDEKEIFALLGTFHIVGRKDWSPFEQAGYLYRRQQQTKFPPNQIAKELGIAESDSKRYIKVYEYMIEQKDLNPEKWSYYEEMLKSKQIKKMIQETPEIEKVIVDSIKQGKLNQASDIRKYSEVGKVSNKQAKKIIKQMAQEKIDIYEAHEQLEDLGSFDKVLEKVKKFREFILNPAFINAEKTDELEFEIKKISRELKKYIK